MKLLLRFLLLGLLGVLPLASHAAASKAQATSSQSTGSASSATVAFGSNITAGNPLSVRLRLVSDTVTGGAATGSGAGCSGATFTLRATGPANSLGERPYVYEGSGTSNGPCSVLVNFVGGSAPSGLFADEWAGLATSCSAFDVQNSASGSAGTPSLSLSSVSANSLIVALVIADSGPPTAGSGYTVDVNTASNWYEVGEYNLDSGSAGSKTVAYTGTANWTMAAMSLKPTCGGGGGTTNAGRASLLGVGQ